VTLTEAEQHIGALVTYRYAQNKRFEDGRITSVSKEYVYVKFGRSTKACYARDIELVPVLDGLGTT
jgi:hypothetical protein